MKKFGSSQSLSQQNNPLARSYRSWDEPTFSTSTALLLTLSIFLVGIGLAIVGGFVGQVALELPYHLRGREATAIVGSQWEEMDFNYAVRYNVVMVYYFCEEEQGVVAARLRGAARLPEGEPLEPGAEVRIVYLPDRPDEVMPAAVLERAGEEIGQALAVGLGLLIAPGAGLFYWLKRSGRLDNWK